MVTSQSALSPEEALKVLLSDRTMLIETLLEVEDKNRDKVPFRLNNIQRDIRANQTGRDIYVKPAQIGASTYFIADFLLDTLTIPGTVAIIISYDEFITGRLLRKARVFYDTLKRRIPSIPKMGHNSTYEMTFPEVNSSFYIGSARSFTFGRGETIHDLLLDEYGFWQAGDAERIFASALQRVPLEPNTKVVIASTANGEGNDFHETYRAAVEGTTIGRSIFTPHFYPWFAHEEYRMGVDSQFALPGDNVDVLVNLDQDEKLLLDHFGVNYDQLRWRRYKKAEMASLRRTGETQYLFAQEYPENDEGCFLSSGDSVYDADLIDDMTRNCYPAQTHMLYADIWIMPEEGKSYLLAIDPGVGKVSESVGTVWEFTTDADGNEHHIHCATLAGLYQDFDMADKCKELGKFYNNAIIAPEDALGIVGHLTDYVGDLYYRTDVVSGKIMKLVGWQTNGATKPYMVNVIAKEMHRIETHDLRIVSQFKNIRWQGDGKKRRAMSIGADDFHDSTGIALVCRDSVPLIRGCVGQAGWPQDW